MATAASIQLFIDDTLINLLVVASLRLVTATCSCGSLSLDTSEHSLTCRYLSAVTWNPTHLQVANARAAAALAEQPDEPSDSLEMPYEADYYWQQHYSRARFKALRSQARRAGATPSRAPLCMR